MENEVINVEKAKEILDGGLEKAGEIIKNNEQISKLMDEVQAKVDKMFGLVESTQKTVDTLQLTFERSGEKIDKSLDDLSDAMGNFSEFTRIIMENPTALFNNSSKGDEGK